jgi:hypothetical protein
VACHHDLVKSVSVTGWGFDGMDGAILTLVAPLLMKEFAINLGTFRSGIQIAALVSFIGLYLGRGSPTDSAGAIPWRSISRCSWGFIGVRGPVMAYTAQIYPPRIRGVGNGFSWAVAFLIGGGAVAVRVGLSARDHRVLRRRIPADPGNPADHDCDHLVLQPARITPAPRSLSITVRGSLGRRPAGGPEPYHSGTRASGHARLASFRALKCKTG